jgi:hypothetical protein
MWRVLHVVARAGRQQPTADRRGVLVVVGDEVNVAGVVHVGFGAAELFGGDILAGDLLDDLRAGDEHLGDGASG